MALEEAMMAGSTAAKTPTVMGEHLNLFEIKIDQARQITDRIEQAISRLSGLSFGGAVKENGPAPARDGVAGRLADDLDHLGYVLDQLDNAASMLDGQV